MIYKENDWVAEVEIVKDMSNGEWREFELKVIRTIQPSRIYKSIPDGTIFTCSKLKDYFGMGVWSLEED